MLNLTNVQVRENRQAINQLLTSLYALQSKLLSINDQMQIEISETKQFLQVYLGLDLVVEELKHVVTEARFHLQTLRQQLSMLTLGHLSPIVIDPENLRELLMEITIHR